MPELQQQIVIDTPIERIFDVIVDYEKYPEFLPEMRHTQVLSRNDGVVVVSFELEIIMRLGYVLRLEEDRPYRVVWTLEQAKMLSVNTGGWHLESIDEQHTRATYDLEIKLRGLIPRSVSDRLIGTTLPETLRRFKERAEGKT